MSTIAATEFLPLVATEAAARDFMVVSLHDVAPSSQQIANTIISELARRGVKAFDQPFEGTHGWYGLYTDSPKNAEKLVAGLGERCIAVFPAPAVSRSA